MLIDKDGRLSGIFTDSDLARLFELHRDSELDGPVASVMTHGPLSVQTGSMMTDAVAIMAERKISELPVIDAEGRPQGLIDITDVVGLLPKETLPENSDASRRQSRPNLPNSSSLRVVHEPETGEDA
jgi:arabinose-5-phosphate isomerase